jgi:hypothetical protein
MAASPPDAFFAIEAMADCHEFRVSIEFEFHCATRALSGVLLIHASFPSKNAYSSVS